MLTDDYTKMDLEKTIQLYFGQVPRSDKPLLLGLSGGEDSLALAHCLIRLKIPFHVAHYDHGWRQTSGREAEELRNWAAERQIPFYTMRSSGSAGKEDEAREQRYSFFESIFKEELFQALVLAHHRDDQVETILKRILEGAHLSKLRGIKEIHWRGTLPIWRPLLGVPKEAIRAYIRTHQLQPIDDYTNRDPKYLRARMRTGLIPMLQEQFGKEISSSLLRLGRYSAELEHYLELQTEKIQPVEGPFGSFWDFSASHPVEMRFVLRNLGVSQQVIDQTIEALTANRANYKINQMFIVDRGTLFFLKPSQKNTSMTFGPIVEGEPQNWRNWWQGKISVNIPAGPATFGPLNPKLRKFQHNHRVPAFLRDTLPVLVQDGNPVGEFLSGKSCYPQVGQSVAFEINVNL